MSFVLAGFCALNCWVIPKLWEPIFMRRKQIPPPSPKGGIVVRLDQRQKCPPYQPGQPALLWAA